MNHNPENFVDRARMMAGATLAVAALAITGCSQESDVVRDDPTTTIDAPTIDSLPQGDASLAEVTSDAELQDLDATHFNCGGKLRDPANPDAFYNTWIEYANQNPDLGPKQISFYESLMGEEALNSLLTNAYGNGLVSPDEHIEGDTRADDLAHVTTSIELGEDQTYSNWTCIDAAGNVNIRTPSKKPFITIPKGQHVDGVVVDANGIADYMTKVNKRADGTSAFDIIPLGPMTVGDKDEIQMYAVVIKASGCFNPITLMPMPKKPGTPTTTPRIPGTTNPKRPTTTLPGTSTKNDRNHTPAGVPGQNRGSGTDTPSTGAGSGGTSQTTIPQGYVPGEWHPTPPAEVVTPTDNNSNTGPVDPGDAQINPDQGGNGAPVAPVAGIDPNVDKGTTNPGSI